jgi:hypothetical protein
LAALLIATLGIPAFAQDQQAPPKQTPGQAQPGGERAQTPGQQQNPEQVFQSLDTNKDQKLSEAELGRLFASAKDDEKKQMFTQWDSDRDGSISMQEFTAHYRSGSTGGDRK